MSLFSYKEFHFDFVGKKKIWYILALIFMFSGLIYMLFAGLNLGLDFTGGSILEVRYEEPVELADVRAIVDASVSHNPSVNESENNQFIIRTEEMEEEESQALLAELSTLGELTQLRSDRIGPVIGQELLKNAQWALLVAGLAMLLYITLRFKFNYAVTAILCLCHDVIVLISMFAIFQIEVNSAFIAAILTIIGYSINNTIVVYDRIRENRGLKARSMDDSTLVNASINETLSRSINTTLAVLILLLSLLLLGGATTRNFVLAMIIGLCAGFFSSCFLAGNLLLEVSKLLGITLDGTKKKAAR